jgi:hypothetical protein
MSNILKGLQLNELSNDTLASYKKKAGADATASDKAGDTKKADKRFSGIVKATNKQFDNDTKDNSNVQAKTDDKLRAYYAQRKAEKQGVTEGVNHSALQGWDEMDASQKRLALDAAGVMSKYDSAFKSSSQLDDILHAARVKAQNQEDELSMGAGGRRELQRQAKQDFEEQRQQLHKEKMEMERFAWEKANTEAERKHEMAKIDKQYTQELRTLQMSHMQDMEKILHADTHELNKMKAEFNMRQAEREKAKPEPELQDEPENNQGNNFDQDTGEPIRPNKPQQSNQWHTSQQVGYTPAKPTKPGNNSDVADVEPKPNKPLALKEFAPVGGDDREPNEEEILRQLAAKWWLGTEQEMAKAQKTLEVMGWEIGQDESGDDDAGVFVIRAGDEHGDTYIAFNHSDLEELNEAYNNYHANRTGFSRGQRDDERHDLDKPTQVWGLKINGKVWSKGGVDVTFNSKEAALNIRNSILKNRPDLEIGLVTKGGVAEGEGNFAGDTPVNLGGVTVKRLQVGDIVKYFGQKAKILAMSKTGNTSRITIANDMGGVTKDVLTSDLKRTSVDEEKQRLDPKCWSGYKKQGTKMKGDTRVNNCVPVKESAILKGLKL